MHAPSWWYPAPGAPLPWQARALAPLAAFWAWRTARRFAGQAGHDGAVPVVCIGNVVAGGTGKTPVALAIARHLLKAGRKVHFLTRGHGGKLAGPVEVDPFAHTARAVGDEPLLLAALAPTWVARDRVAGARAAVAAGAEVIVMDDGLQNHPSLHRDLVLAVVDAETGFGNGRVIPAGPCREPPATGLAKAHAVILMGDFDLPVPDAVATAGKPVIRARMQARVTSLSLTGVPVIAFAGIGRPEKFFRTVKGMGARLIDAIPFADHEVIDTRLLDRMIADAADRGALLVTTEKDLVRLPEPYRRKVTAIPVTLRFEDEGALDGLLAPLKQ